MRENQLQFACIWEIVIYVREGLACLKKKLTVMTVIIGSSRNLRRKGDDLG